MNAVPIQAGAGPAAEQQRSQATDARRTRDRRALRDALTVGLTVGASGTAFGVAAAGAHLSLAQTCALSLLVFTGASQFALIGALSAGAGPLAAVAGALFLGVRNALYGLRLGDRLRIPRVLRPFAAQLVIDETTAVTLAQPDRRSARIGFGTTGVTLYAVWNLTTLLGAVGAGALGDPARYGLDAAGPAVFLALLAPRLRESGTEGAQQRAVAGLGVVLLLGGMLFLPAGVPVLLAVAGVPLVALTLRQRKQEENANANENANENVQGEGLR
jgi:predicted branched-subunit amino acid permease